MKPYQMENLFPADTYDTPPGRRSLTDKLLLGNRLHFYLKNFGIFRKTGSCARKGMLDQERQVFFSNQNIRLTEECGGVFHLRGLNHLREMTGRPAVLIGNHMSLLETAVFHAIARPYIDFTFVIKESLLDVPYFGDIMRTLKAIPVSRTNPREDFKTVLQKGKEVLAEGRSIILFPQATRSVEFKPEEFNTIGVKLARSADVPVLPFALKTDFVGTGKLLRDLGPIRRDRQIYFEFAAPMEVRGAGKEEYQAICRFIQERLAEWNAAERSGKA